MVVLEISGPLVFFGLSGFEICRLVFERVVLFLGRLFAMGFPCVLFSLARLGH